MSRTTTLTIFGTLVVAFTATTFWLAERAILRGFAKVEIEDSLKEDTKFVNAIRTRLENLEKTTGDWAQWSALLDYARGLNKNFAREEMDPEMIRALDVDIILGINSKGKVFHNLVYSDDPPKPAPTELIRYFQSGSSIHEKAIEEGVITHFISTSVGIILFCARSIKDSSGQGKSGGVLIFMRQYDSRLQSELNEKLRVNSSIRIIGRSAINGSIQARAWPPSEVRIISDKEVQTIATRPDVFGFPVVERMIRLDRPIYQTARMTVRVLGFALVTAGLFFVVAGWILLRTLLNRIRFSRDSAIASEQRLKLALEASSGGVWDYDFENQKVFFDAKYRSILGYSENELPNSGRVFKDLCHPEDFPTAQKKYRDFLANISPTFSVQFRMRAKDGAYRWILSEAAALRDKEGRPLRVIGWNRDISDQKIQEKVIEQQRMHMAQTAKMTALGEMAGGIAHEINNPLAIISGYAQGIAMILEGSNPSMEKIAQNAKKIDTTVDRIAKIVKSLRSFSRDGSNDPLELVKVRNIVEEAIPLVKERILRRSIEFRESLEDLDSSVRIRPIEIGQVLLNLLNNAYDEVENDSSGWIELKTKLHSSFFELSVSNSGNPIPEEIRNRMFQPFFTTKKLGHGTGLGLSISRGLVERNEGWLLYDDQASHPRFIIRLPLAHRDEKQIA